MVTNPGGAGPRVGCLQVGTAIVAGGGYGGVRVRCAGARLVGWSFGRFRFRCLLFLLFGFVLVSLRRQPAFRTSRQGAFASSLPSPPVLPSARRRRRRRPSPISRVPCPASRVTRPASRLQAYRNSIVVGEDRHVSVWSLSKGQSPCLARASFCEHQRPIRRLELMGRWIVTCSGDYVIRLWDSRTGVCIRELGVSIV